MDLKDYKVGMYFGGYANNKKLYCSCGFVTPLEPRADKVCGGCGNTHVVDGGCYEKTRRVYDGIYECVEKTDSSFHLKKREIVINFSGDSRTLRFKHIHDWELLYSLRDRSTVLKKDGEAVACNQSNHLNICQFFKWAKSEKEIIPIFSTDRSQHLFEFAYKEYGCQRYEYVSKLGRALMRLLGRSANLELFANAGFGENLKNISREPLWTDSTETKPHKIFGVPKYMLPVLRDIGEFCSSDVKRLRELDATVGGNNVKIAMEIFREEASLKALSLTADYISQLYSEYGYKDVKRLALYFAREVKLEQGIEIPGVAALELRDYVRMCRDMEIEPKEKYPKSLKKLHDIAQMNHKTQADAIQNKKMKEVVDGEDYQGLTYTKKPYVIVTPKDASDLIKEGSSLSHCVASYVKDVIDKKCKILFLRDIGDLDKSLVTIEVRENNIRQVRGFGNRSAAPLEMDFVREWAKSKELNLATY